MTINTTEHVELACRAFMHTHPDIPIVLQAGRFPNYTYSQTAAAVRETVWQQGCVRLIPSLDGVAVSGSGAYHFGVNDNIGDAIIVEHGTTWEEPDVHVIAGEAFQAAIGAAVKTKAAAVAAHYAEAGIR